MNEIKKGFNYFPTKIKRGFNYFPTFKIFKWISQCLMADLVGASVQAMKQEKANWYKI